LRLRLLATALTVRKYWSRQLFQRDASVARNGIAARYLVVTGTGWH
jgi:hypothetical protein